MTGRNTGVSSTNPELIRSALTHADAHTFLATSARYGVSVRQLQRWRERRDAAVAAGGTWPTDADLTYWRARQPVRAAGRTRGRQYTRRRALQGPLFIDSTGTTRRLRALAALGWRLVDLGAELGVRPNRVGHLARGTTARVHRDTASAVAAVYDQLSMVQGPSELTRAHAARQCWAPPLCWDDENIDDPKARPRKSGGRRLTKGQAFDEIAVERAMAGDNVHLTPAERAEAAVRLTGQGLSAAQVAARLRTTPRNVVRYRRDVA